jgi:pentatricopeptide repeat protein
VSLLSENHEAGNTYVFIMRKIVLFFTGGIFLFHSISCFSQFFHDECFLKWEADSLYSIGRYEKAIEKYKQRNEIKDNRNNFYSIAICYCKLNEIDSAAYYFKELLKRGFCYHENQTLKEDQYLLCLQKHPDYETFHSLASLNYKQFTQEFNPELQKEFLRRRELDQAPDDMDNIRSSNMLYLDSILNVYRKWPGYSILGREGDNAAWLIAQHADNFIDFQEKCYQYLLKAIEEYNTNPNNVAYLYDRIQINKGLQQKYGTQMRVIDDKVIFINLEDEKNVDKYRTCFNLPPLSFYKEALEKRYLKEK